jgi:MFS family permease
MDSSSSVIHRLALSPARIPFYYGWVNLAVAALAMVGTLPGRTQGLGLIAEPLMRDLGIDHVFFAQINLWAALIGAVFCLGVGRLVDRVGSRTVLTAISLMLGTVVLLMSGVKGVLLVALLITLIRGLGQSALSVVSLTMVGHWFVRRINLAMAVYTILLSVGFMIAFLVVGAAVIGNGWRVAWAGIGGALLLVLVPAAWLLVRRAPEGADTRLDYRGRTEFAPDDIRVGFTLRQALSTTRFWIFALSSSVYGLIASGIGLFNESVLAERGFDASTYHRSLALTAITALFGNFLGGWLTAKWSMKRLMALAMWLLAGSLLGLPRVTTQTHVAAYAIVMGMAGGFVIVIFFSFWSRSFGRAHLGKIQGAAQTLTVLASAVGPLLMAWGVAWTGSYAAGFYLLAVVVVILGVSAWFVPVPPDLSLETQQTDIKR